MRYLMFVKADERSEAGEMPSEQDLTTMTAYNEELVKAGVMLDGNGLARSAEGVRVTFGDTGNPTVIDGPFAEAKELVAGYWLIEVSSREEAIEWARRAPLGPGGTIELRRVLTEEDFGDNYTPEVREAEARIRDAETLRREESSR
ncbi:YciI family protein [Saccharomonospora xinjiangensis]|uniref:YCII-related domain-containing protein n=1 Tax=Saccharomonospora xinjiangensis XJ-54 TaxID=882086 RepID=I0V8M8_9PSEU|nr:YciI family protein [Saccharomonospora xinjiangensis]EID56481.1 hypothetical protein SacxiDRAFT_4300 [Saccharomonospora xinjiangensis XJ-54]